MKNEDTIHKNRNSKKAHTNESFIKRAKEVHGDRYDYSKVEYVDNKTGVCIICPEHGEFMQRPSTHFFGSGCPKCGRFNKKSNGPKRLTHNEFLNRSKEIHGNKYDYSKTEYKNYKEKVCIICPKHGEFWQSPNKHLHGQGCPKCGRERTNLYNFKTQETLISELKGIYGDEYDYSKIEYVKMKKHVCIICKKHGEFFARPDHLIRGHGCPSCKESHLEREIRIALQNNDIEHIYQYRNAEILNRQTLDYFIPKYNIAIECQGEQHFKDNFFKSMGVENSEEMLYYVQNLDNKKRKICKKYNIVLLYYTEGHLIKYIPKAYKTFDKADDLIEYIKNYK